MRSSLIHADLRHKVGGFTLLEMMITLAIFIMLSGAVFGIITGVLRTASILQDNQNRRDQLVALDAYLHQQLTGLPADGILISYRRGEGEGLKQNGIIFGQGERLTALDAVLQANGYYTIRLANMDPSNLPKFSAPAPLVFEADIAQNSSAIAWAPLIHDVRQIEWKFQILNATEWLEMWSDLNTRPNLIELTLEQAGDLKPSTIDFWIPRIEPIAPVTALPTQP